MDKFGHGNQGYGYGQFIAPGQAYAYGMPMPQQQYQQQGQGLVPGMAGVSLHKAPVPTQVSKLATTSKRSSSRSKASARNGDCNTAEGFWGGDDCDNDSSCDRRNHGTAMLALPDLSAVLGAGAAGVYPERLRWVAPAWVAPGAGGAPVPVVPSTGLHFVTISAAIASIIAATPLVPAASPYVIFLYPGTYAENLDLPSNVYLVGIADDAVNITGDVTYSAGVGINAGYAALDERVLVKNVTLVGGSADFTVFATKPVGNVAELRFEHSAAIGTVFTSTGRSTVGAADLLSFKDCDMTAPGAGATVAATDQQIVFAQSDVADYTFALTSTVAGIGSFAFGNGALRLPAIAGALTSTLALNQIANSYLDGFVALTGAGNIIEVLNCAVGPNLNLSIVAGDGYLFGTRLTQANIAVTGGGRLDRDLWTQVIAVAGQTTAFTAVPPYVNPTTVTPDSVPVVTAAAGAIAYGQSAAQLSATNAFNVIFASAPPATTQSIVVKLDQNRAPAVAAFADGRLQKVQ